MSHFRTLFSDKLATASHRTGPLSRAGSPGRAAETSERNVMIKSTILLLAALFLPISAALASQSRAEQETVGVAQGAAVAPKPVTETMRGVVESIDEGSDTITLRLSPETTQQFRVQDGLLFNAVRFGDPVEITVQDIAGAKTIVELKRE